MQFYTPLIALYIVCVICFMTSTYVFYPLIRSISRFRQYNCFGHGDGQLLQPWHVTCMPSDDDRTRNVIDLFITWHNLRKVTNTYYVNDSALYLIKVVGFSAVERWQVTSSASSFDLLNCDAGFMLIIPRLKLHFSACDINISEKKKKKNVLKGLRRVNDLGNINGCLRLNAIDPALSLFTHTWNHTSRSISNPASRFPSDANFGMKM